MGCSVVYQEIFRGKQRTRMLKIDKDKEKRNVNGEVKTRLWTDEERDYYLSLPKPDKNDIPSMIMYDMYRGNPKYRGEGDMGNG